MKALLNLILISLIPIGWILTRSFFKENILLYDILNIINFVTVMVIIHCIYKKILINIHHWMIFLILYIGYFIKFYILCFLMLNQEKNELFLQIYYPTIIEYFYQENLIVEYYKIITLIMFCFSCLTLLFKSLQKQNIKSILELPKCIINSEKLERKINNYIKILIYITITLLFITLRFNIGVPNSEKVEAPLPFRLAGLIILVQNLVIPICLMSIIYFSKIYGLNNIKNKALLIYITVGILLSFITTSKAIIFNLLITLILYLIVTNQISKKTVFFITLLIPILFIFNLILSNFRTQRADNLDLNISIIIDVILTTLNNSTITIEANNLMQLLLVMITRVNGIDSLLNILNYQPLFNWERSLDLIFLSSNSIAEYYAVDILGWPAQHSTGFSPSLIGYIYFIFPTNLGICVGFIIYVLFWHIIVKLILKAKIINKSVALIYLATIIAFYTSEGTLESLPLRISIYLIIITIIDSVFFKNFLSKNRSNNYNENGKFT
jgi:hypothetical protein